MELSSREFWTVAHGLILGSLYLLAFAGGLTDLWNMNGQEGNAQTVEKRVRRLTIGSWIMTVVAWATVIVGTYIVYPWYRAPIPTSPRSLILAVPAKAGWHNFGMEWKEHVAWLTPILITAVAYLITTYGAKLAQHQKLRLAVMVLLVLSFAAAGFAGVFGAFLNKVAPVL